MPGSGACIGWLCCHPPLSEHVPNQWRLSPLPWSCRGISGGQKRRLTCGELLVGGRELLLLDEISTGEAAPGSSRRLWLHVVDAMPWH